MSVLRAMLQWFSLRRLLKWSPKRSPDCSMTALRALLVVGLPLVLLATSRVFAEGSSQRS
jgi:hypothetical protein